MQKRKLPTDGIPEVPAKTQKTSHASTRETVQPEAPVKPLASSGVVPEAPVKPPDVVPEALKTTGVSSPKN